MSEEFKVSVVIPVYNAAAFVHEAVESALALEATGEVLLIEDASPDDSLAVCEALVEANPDRVRLLRHPNGDNRGAGPSRNLGIRNARCDFVAFLDADDFFLPNRFEVAARIFAERPDVDGVYEAIDVYYQTLEAQIAWITSATSRPTTLVTMRTEHPPQELFERLVLGQAGGFISMVGVTIKREVFDRPCGLFDPIRHEDKAMFIKLAAFATLVPGRLDEPVARYRVHGDNRTIKAPNRHTFEQRQRIMWETLWAWGQANLDVERQHILDQALVSHHAVGYRRYSKIDRWVTGSARFLHSKFKLLRFVMQNPSFLLKTSFWRRLFTRRVSLAHWDR